MLCMHVGPNKVQLIYCSVITLCGYNDRNGRSELEMTSWMVVDLPVVHRNIHHL
jgi:hypothetical protein